jgi:GAF domain-containing protein/HAMP domain-containing protein
VNASLARLDPRSWPIWLKLAVGLGSAILVPLLLALIAIQPGLQELGLQNLRSFVTQNGERQQQGLTSAMTQARSNLTIFLNDATNDRLLVSLLLANSPLFTNTDLTPISAEQMQTIFERALLVPSTSLYNNVRLLDRNGQLVAFSGIDESLVTAAMDVDQSGQAVYQAAVTEQLNEQPEAQLVVASAVGDQTNVELIQPILWRDGRPIGYLVAELNPQRVFYDNLTFTERTFPAYSYLVTSNRQVIAPETVLAQARISADDSTAVRRALGGTAADDVYALEANDTEVAGYFAPIPNASMALVTEVPTVYAGLQTASFFDARLISVGVVAVVLATALTFLLNNLLAPPLVGLRAAVSGMADGDFDRPIPDPQRADEIGQLSGSVSTMREQVQSVIADLQARVAVRARDVAATHEISRFVVSQRDQQRLMDQVVNLIVERFTAIYHAQIFLLDSDGQYAFLRASTGEAGRELLAIGHKLAVGSTSVIGQVTEQGRLVVARDTETSTVHRRNEYLPDTRAELAIPLRVGNDIIGALDVQSRERDAFDEDLTHVLQTMADQIAIAIMNARLYQESMRQMEDVAASNRAATRSAWQEYLRGQRMAQLSGEAGMPVAAAETSPLRAQALASGQIAVGEPNARKVVPIAVPVLLRGQVLGAVEWEIPARDLDENRLQLAQELANRLAVSLDNARLFEESQRATERERVVNDIAAKITAQTDIDEILQTAVREVGQALRAPQVSIRLGKAEPAPSSNGNGKGHSNGNGYHTS